MQIFSKFLPMVVAGAFGLISVSMTARTTNADFIRMSREEALGVQKIHLPQGNSAHDRFGTMLAGQRAAAVIAPEQTYTPDSSLSKVRGFGDVDGPDGQLWYYTTELVSKNIQHAYYVEKILTEYIFTIYDAQMKEVGKIHDKMRYEADEIRVPGPENGCNLLPVITKNFFNNDDKFEVVISLSVNTTTENKNNYRSVVYSLGGEKESLEVEDVNTGKMVTKQFDKPIAQYPELVVDVLEVPSAEGEQIYMTFSHDVYASDEQRDGSAGITDDYWETLTKAGMTFNTYGKADSEGHLTKALDVFIPFLNQQGDQENTPPLLTFVHNDKGYIAVPRYAETFYNPYGPSDDMTMRENNNLTIDIYELTGSSAKKIQETSIPVVKMPGDNVLATYYSVGDLRGSKDVNIGDFTQDGRASFYLTRYNYMTGDATSDFCYYVFDPEGNKIRTIFENATGTYQILDLEGFEPQQMFVSYDEIYVYNFVNLLTGFDSNTVKISSYVDAYNTGDEDAEELLLAKVARVPFGNTSKYAFEMREPLTDESGNNFIRICWFDSKGKFERVDHVNMGQNVDYAQCFIHTPVLNPTLFCEDTAHEYCTLIKRSHADSTELTEELLISQPTAADLTGGKTLLHLTPSDTKGALSGINVYDNGDSKKLMIAYLDGNSDFTVDFYDLPFHTAGIETITPDSTFENISFDGTTLRAEGNITIYAVDGKVVAEGNGAVNVASLSSGIYVAVNGTSAYKFLVN